MEAIKLKSCNGSYIISCKSVWIGSGVCDIVEPEGNIFGILKFLALNVFKIHHRGMPFDGPYGLKIDASSLLEFKQRLVFTTSEAKIKPKGKNVSNTI